MTDPGDSRRIAEMERIAAVIPVYRNASDTIECLRSLSTASPGCDSVVVVDDASGDGTAERVSSAFPDAQMIVRPRNGGFARAANDGIERALRSGAERILLLNNDTVVAPDLVGELSRAVRTDASIGIAGPVSFYHAEPRRVWASGGRVHLRTGLRSHLRDIPPGIVDRAYMPAVCWMVPRRIFETHGLLPTEYGMYFEDLEYCLRVRHGGRRIVCVPEARLRHKVSAGTGGESNPRVKYYSSRNRLRFVRRMGYPSSVPLVAVIQAVECSLRALAGDGERAAAVFRGTLAGLRRGDPG